MTAESETSTEHLSEVIRFFLIASDKWYLYPTNLYLFPPYKQPEPTRLTICKKNTKNHQSYHAFCSLKISIVEDFSIFLRKINVIGLR